MILAMLMAATPLPETQYPRTWANDYCVYRVAEDLTHEEAEAKATARLGTPSDFTWELIAQNKTWCDDARTRDL